MVQKKANMVRQLYQHETKLKTQVAELEDQLYWAPTGMLDQNKPASTSAAANQGSAVAAELQSQITTLQGQLAKEKETAQKKATMVRQMYQHETKLKEELKALNDQLSAKEQAL